MRVLVACEFSGIVREAFRKRGHDSWSCDLLPALDASPFHQQRDIFDALSLAFSDDPWDLLIAHPPCTYLAVSGARWWKDRLREQESAIWFFKHLIEREDVLRIAIENPIGVISSRYRRPDQIIQPWQFGHGETKATCLWLKNLPLLQPTKVVDGREGRVWKESPGIINGLTRQQRRSITYQGIAEAMAEQWGDLSS
jgi:site-specific DNA-cytosine methylase